ncbi:MAG TPA: hypothetical protein EYP19_06520 [Desulfobacterales bacterium]|nr:hypothetical protein [Desulfobacterales bacterium]
MARLEWVLSFAQITFPVFLLIPTLITSFHVSITPLKLGRFFVALWVDYLVIVVALAWSAVVQEDWAILGFLIVSMVLIGIALFYVTKWTLDEQLWIWMNR